MEVVETWLMLVASRPHSWFRVWRLFDNNIADVCDRQMSSMANSVDVKDVKDARHLQSQQSCYADISAVQTTQIDSSVQDSAKLDSTGMFHWCPAQSLTSCLHVSHGQHTATLRHVSSVTFN